MKPPSSVGDLFCHLSLNYLFVNGLPNRIVSVETFLAVILRWFLKVANPPPSPLPV